MPEKFKIPTVDEILVGRTGWNGWSIADHMFNSFEEALRDVVCHLLARWDDNFIGLSPTINYALIHKLALAAGSTHEALCPLFHTGFHPFNVPLLVSIIISIYLRE